MIITHVIGGIGNQMFQYAVGRALSLRRQVSLKVDITEYAQYPLRTYDLHYFNLKVDTATPTEIIAIQGKTYRGLTARLLHYLNPQALQPKPGYYKEHGFSFDAKVLNFPDNTLLEGFWQTEKYFVDIARTIRQDFTIRDSLDPANQEIWEQIKQTKAVALHVRRGDYVSNAVTNKFHGTTSLDYYRAAVQKMLAAVPGATFFIFSDDHPWVQANLTFDAPKIYVTANDASRPHFDLHLMRACQHHIIANSSFSWWGAWLAEHPGQRVIAPREWFKDKTVDTRDLLPERWERL